MLLAKKYKVKQVDNRTMTEAIVTPPAPKRNPTPKKKIARPAMTIAQQLQTHSGMGDKKKPLPSRLIAVPTTPRLTAT